MRSPVYSTEKYNQTTIAELLRDSYYLAALKSSSQEVYEQLERDGFEENKISYRMKCTLRRYFNRMCFRPTPFGLNSTVCRTSWGKDISLKLGSSITAVIQTDFRELIEKAAEVIKLKDGDQDYFSNPSLYTCADHYRYLKVNNTDPLKLSYALESVQRTDYLETILELCLAPKGKQEIISALLNRFGGSIVEGTIYIDGLIASQILLPQLQAHITGDFAQSINSIFPGAVAESIKENITLPSSFSIDKDRFTEKAYINAERQVTGTISTSYQHAIRDGIDALASLLSEKPSPDLNSFKERFLKKFDRQTIPLMQALDPELGVGFAGIGINAINPELAVPDKADFQPSWPQYSAVHALLLRKWQEDPHSIELQKNDLETLTAPEQKPPYAPTTSVLFRIAGKQVFVEQAGGPSGAALPGRFSTISEELRCHTALIAKLEETQNPDVVFAEIAHFSDSRIANIERRKHFYQYEIPVCSGSLLPHQKQLPLSDLYIFIREGKIILWSQKLSRRIIPRHSSAYNFTRSNLAVFRFLCELQSDGLNTIGHFHLEHYFPRLTFYPRVSYKNTILQLATWKIKTDAYTHLRHSSDKIAQAAAMREMVATYHLPRYISVDVQDNQLIFDTYSNDCLELLAFSFKPGTLTIKEFPFPQASAILQDSEGRPHINQFVACLYKEGATFEGLQPQPFALHRRLMPTEEWLYFKIYCHPIRANEILQTISKQIIKRLRDEGLADQWFFIRYNDPDFHIRLRIKIKPNHNATIIEHVNLHLKPFLHSGKISDIQITGYDREWERYPESIIADVELSFQNSSEIITEYLSDTHTTEKQLEHYRFAFLSIKIIIAAFGLEHNVLMDNYKSLYHGFEKEFSIGHEALNQKLRKLRDSRILDDNSFQKMVGDTGLLQNFEHSYNQVANKTAGWPEVRRLQLFNDLIHMHLNRFFVTDARRQELMIYYFLFKNYQAINARQRIV